MAAINYKLLNEDGTELLLETGVGDGTTTNKHTPTKIGTSDWTVIAGGGYHSLGIKEAIPSSNFFLFFN